MTYEPAPRQSAGTVAALGQDRSAVPALLRVGLHLLVGALLALAAGRAVVDQVTGWPGVVAGAVLVAAV